MEQLELLKLIIGGGEVALLVVVLVQMVGFMRAQQSQQGANDNAQINVMARMADNLAASTEAFRALSQKHDDTQTLVMGNRRELRTHHEYAASHFDTLQTAITGLPSQVRKQLEPDFRQVREFVGAIDQRLIDQYTATGDRLNALSESIEQLQNETRAALSDWQRTGAQLQQMIERNQQKPEPGESVQSTPEPSENETMQEA